MKSLQKRIVNFVRFRWKLLLVLALILIGGGIWWYQTTYAVEEEVSTQNPVRQPIRMVLELSGHVDAKEKARMRFIAGGKLTYVGFEEGDTVKKWQTIARIDAATLQKQLDQDLNNYLKERWDWEETVDANRDQPLTLSERRLEDKEQWDLNNTVLTVEIRDIAIKNTALYAPFDGILTAAPTSVAGMQVLATDYFELVNPETLIFRAAVDESDVGLVELDQTATIILDSYEDLEIQTQVQYVSFTSTETTSGTAFIVEFPLSQAEFSETLRIGMNGDIEILLEEKEDVLTVPTIALIERDNITYVEVLTESGEIEEREIKLGLETDDIVEVLSGLSESDQVVIPE